MRTQQEVNNYLQDTVIKNAINLLDIEECLNNDGLQLPNNVIIHRDGISSIDFIKWFENKPRSQYPKTYKECRAILDNYITSSISGYKAPLLVSLQKLLVCRDAYWKIAGEQMRMDKPWEPDWAHGNEKYYCIATSENEIVLGEWYIDNKILAFPTEEMRDEFYENFKNLINECKELL